MLMRDDDLGVIVKMLMGVMMKLMGVEMRYDQEDGTDTDVDDGMSCEYDHGY